MIQFSNQKHGNALLNYLAKAQNPTTLDTLAQELGISRRSLYYVIHKVNDELNESGLDGISNIYGEGYYLDSTTINFLKNGNLSKKITTTELFNLDSLSIKLNKHERLLVLSFFLITRNGSSINYLANLLNISRNTVISDLTEVKSLFSKKSL
ncbi:HTH domain-containing protein [Ligilactobacillus agilis]|uniref:HTH domain-containing protein n=1 Tax=Ligilactobacillus agilis TaxID=1601 RepID=UPI0022E612DA|nr:HTH domain-containing protein [Ligilactobacillus agilis]